MRRAPRSRAAITARGGSSSRASVPSGRRGRSYTATISISPTISKLYPRNGRANFVIKSAPTLLRFNRPLLIRNRPRNWRSLSPSVRRAPLPYVYMGPHRGARTGWPVHYARGAAVINANCAEPSLPRTIAIQSIARALTDVSPH